MEKPAAEKLKSKIVSLLQKTEEQKMRGRQAKIQNLKSKISLVLVFATLAAAAPHRTVADEKRPVPDRVPLKRSSQIRDGFGINSDMPREPYLPWNRWWWTRMFDAGINWIRIGQYENSTDYTSWDWVEQKRGVYSLPPQVDDYVNSLVDSGVNIQIQLLYGNPMYTSLAGRLPDSILPVPGSVHNPDRSIYSVFWPPKTPEQIRAFTNYAKWMVNHFRGRVHYYEIWNEPGDEFWNPRADPEEYGRLVKAVAPAIHEADPEAKVVFGGLGGTGREFPRRALAACQCASGIDVFAYHVYPDYGRNMNPEAMDDKGHQSESPRLLREMVRKTPGIRPDLIFWNDESNSIPSWEGSDESVQTKYLPRDLLYDRVAGVRTFIWELAPGVDGNEADDFGMIHGMMLRPNDFAPRPAFYAVQNTNALFSDTTFDHSIEIQSPDLSQMHRPEPFLAYGFRSRSGKAIVAYWLAAHSKPGNVFPPLRGTLLLKNTGIAHPVLIDITSGKITPLEWKPGTKDTLESVAFRDSVMAVADESYFDWPLLPEVPSALNVAVSGNSAKLTWEVHGGDPTGIVVERLIAERGSWERVAKLPASSTEYNDSPAVPGERVSYRVRAVNDAGESAYSNIATVRP